MSAQKPASWAYAEEFVTENKVIESARRRGEELGATPVGNGAGVLLRLLAAAVKAKSVVEVGTGAGTSGLWMLQGMPEDGILTTIDVEAEHQGVAKKAYAEAGIAHQRTRVITGRALDVLPRMTDGAYDMVVIDGDKVEYPEYVSHGIRLLRSGGVLVLDNMLWHDKVADPAARDEQTSVLRDLGKALRDDERLIPALLPVGDGVLAAVKR
jgi:predicted O-methyltransferase YrrM